MRQTHQPRNPTFIYSSRRATQAHISIACIILRKRRKENKRDKINRIIYAAQNASFVAEQDQEIQQTRKQRVPLLLMEEIINNTQ